MRPPEFWNVVEGREAAPMLRSLLAPVSWLYARATARRIATTQPFDPGVPVICIGNATLGGTGKTPVASYILASLRRMGVEAVGLSRGYKGTERGPVRVNADHTAAEVGDEPLLLARQGPVWIAAGRDDGARAAVAWGAQAIVMDDGHQNPTLRKRLSLLVVDGQTGFGNGRVFPAGPLREPVAAALERTDAVILMLPHMAYRPDEALIARLRPRPIIPATLVPQAGPPAGPLYAFAGIGRPQKFFDTLIRAGGELAEGIAFSDHHKYSADELDSLDLLARELGAQLITTEKDFVRLPGEFRQRVHAFPVRVEFGDELTLQRLLHPIIAGARR